MFVNSLTSQWKLLGSMEIETYSSPTAGPYGATGEFAGILLPGYMIAVCFTPPTEES
jgi:hypothetical protein